MNPQVRARKLDSLDISTWEDVSAAFRHADFANFQQHWRPEPELGFRSAKAGVVWTDDSLIVYAELCDDNIFNEIPEREFNRMSIANGDVFEIFLKPSGQESYFEFHVNPNNQKLQLRLPCRDAWKVLKDRFKSPEELFESFKIWNPVIESRVEVLQGQWRVVAKIPISMMLEGEPVKAGTKWTFSFCRYDYTRPAEKPVCSSTSPHKTADFHLLDDYGTLEFVESTK